MPLTAGSILLLLVQTSLALPWSAEQRSGYIDCGQHVLSGGFYRLHPAEVLNRHHGNPRSSCRYGLTAGPGVESITVSCRRRLDTAYSSSSCEHGILQLNGVDYCLRDLPVTLTTSAGVAVALSSDASGADAGLTCTVEASAVIDGAAAGSSNSSVAVVGNVIGGTKVPPNKYPWQARLVNRTGDPAAQDDSSLRASVVAETFCGGSLVSSRFVLTAAHCVARDASSLEVRLGSVHTGLMFGEQRFLVSDIFLHPRYGQLLYNYDCAMLKLQRSVEFTQSIQPIDLPMSGGRDTYEGRRAVVAGFGKIEGDLLATVLHELNVTVVPQTLCQISMGELIGPSLLCVTKPFDRRRGVCHGDSGSPLVVLQDGRYVVIGFTAFAATPCGTPGHLDVFTRVTEVLPFIQTTLADGRR